MSRIGSGTDPYSRGCLSCGPGKSTKKDQRNPVLVCNERPEYGGQRPCRFACRKPTQSAERFADIPMWDSVASPGELLPSVPCWVLWARVCASVGARTGGGIFVSSERGGGS